MANITWLESANHAWHVLSKVLLKGGKVCCECSWRSILDGSLKLRIRLDRGQFLDEAVDRRLDESCSVRAKPAEESEHAPVERLEQGDVPEATG